MGRCTFDPLWREDEKFKDWIESVEGDKYSAHCKVCKKSIALASMGKNSLYSHARSEKHKPNLQNATKFAQEKDQMRKLLQQASPKAGTRIKYRLHLEAEKKKDTEEACKKRQAEEDAKKDLDKRRNVLEGAIHQEEAVEKHMDAAENSTGSKVLSEVMKANALRKAIKEKKQSLQDLSM
ncbi:hypothetical protein CAPTEDRAFT_198951 [Capitella teleta]|uniref:Uncharacterized protein n=1 Tax=Capitella teleta TaxID=283909 RepID=R7V3P0_CAPTE|nr:hypothetical protein CAPTEDRAFT_198951 [Capitella teleta]|eukprot:ELU13087.1 hypothetical protein CAPTEDRAFT_198951 [Capitella teleta]